MANNALKLFCIVEGDTSQNICEVDIDSTETVAKLKKRIKEEKPLRFKDYDADELTLWRVSIPNPAENDNRAILLNTVEGERAKLGPMSRLSAVLTEKPPEETIHIIVQVPKAAEPVAISAAAPAPSVHKQWYVNSTLYPDLRERYYFADQSLQNQGLIENVIEGHFLRMYGPRSSGKSSRVYQAMEQLATKGYECLYVTLEGCLFTSDHVFWETFGKKMEHNKLPVPITSSTTFQTAFTKNSNKKKRWERPVILFIDEFDPLHDNGCETACSSVLSAIRGIKTTRNQTVIHSIVVIGTFAILELNQTLLSLSPFTGTENFRVASFTVEQVQTLFKEYSTDYHITIELEVVENIYDLTCGHAGLVCLCGRAIHQELYPKFGATGTLTFDTWARFASNDLLRKVPSYATFSRLVNTLTSGKHNDAVDCLRANFLGVFDEYVQIPDVQIAECKLARFLAAQGVLLSDPKNELGSFKMISPLVDTLMRRTVIPALYPSDPLKPVPTCGDIIFIPDIMKEALRFFDKELIRLAPKRSFKTAGRLPVNGSTDQKVPRESVYDQELGRVLASWLSKQERYSVTGQWHTETATRNGNLKGKHKYLDLVISKEGAPTIILEVLATCTEAVVKEHLDRANKYKDRLFAYASWVIHFTREDNYLNHAFWPLESTLQKGINMLHIWHNEDFNDVQMSGLWKDVHGNTEKIEKVHVQSRC